MAGLKLAAFAGMAPRVSKTMLADNESQNAVNTKLYAGDLRSWQKPGSLTPKVVRSNQAVMSMARGVGIDGSFEWMTWASDVDVVKGNINTPVEGVKTCSVYYTGDGSPKKTSATICAAAGVPASGIFPNDYLEMGVPGPASAPAVQIKNPSSTDPTLKGLISSNVVVSEDFHIDFTPATGSAEVRDLEIPRTPSEDLALFGAVETEYRVYVYTYVSMFGDIEEESAPSPVSEQTMVRFGQAVTVKGFVYPPQGKYNYKYIRVYRSVAGTDTASFLFVGQFDINQFLTTKEFDDSVKAEGLGEACKSFYWSPPPDALEGLVVMANGVYAGFKGREIYFSEPFMPHAWNLSNALSTEFEIVGIKAFGQSLYVGTKGNPYVVTGTTPESMTTEKLPIFEPCASKRSIAVDQFGCYYASPNGIVSIGPGGADNVTRNLFTQYEWAKYNPSSMLGGAVDGRYYLFYETNISPIVRGGLILDKYVQQSPLSLTSLYADAIYIEPTESKMYIFVDDEVKQWDGDFWNGLPYEWYSKLFIVNRPCNFAAVQVEADFGDIAAGALEQERIDKIKAANQVVFAGNTNLKGALHATVLNTFTTNGSLLQDLPGQIDNRYVLLTVYADGQKVAELNIQNRNLYRLPSGFKADRWEFKVNGNIPLRHIKIAETAKELASL